MEQLSVDTSSVSREYVLQFPLASISAPVLVRNVFYEFDSAALTDDSTVALDSLVTLLNENPNITIELSAHCDYRGNDEYNERLSQRRAESVVHYLIQHGIAADRVTPKGYGESRPKVVKRRIAEQYPFLHEGDTLTEDFILALPEEQRGVPGPPHYLSDGPIAQILVFYSLGVSDEPLAVCLVSEMGQERFAYASMVVVQILDFIGQ